MLASFYHLIFASDPRTIIAPDIVYDYVRIRPLGQLGAPSFANNFTLLKDEQMLSFRSRDRSYHSMEARNTPRPYALDQFLHANRNRLGFQYLFQTSPTIILRHDILKHHKFQRCYKNYGVLFIHPYFQQHLPYSTLLFRPHSICSVQPVPATKRAFLMLDVHFRPLLHRSIDFPYFLIFVYLHIVYSLNSFNSKNTYNIGNMSYVVLSHTSIWIGSVVYSAGLQWLPHFWYCLLSWGLVKVNLTSL